MRRYETVFIADPDLSGDVQAQLFEKTKNIISDNNGVLVDFDEWGNRRLAYEIKKKQRGHYVRLDYCGDGAVVSELEGTFRIDERILKFMTIFLQDDADPQAIQAALASAKEKPAEEAAEDAAPASGNDTAKAASTEPAPAEAAPEPAEDAAAPEKDDE
ncbi:MAG: 30S ribosomal protein S6 [Thermodesulfobacteriota bacterium]|nr:30S ribosomal protein S6 [Thermodesulfobacteriota bacterium]